MAKFKAAAVFSSNMVLQREKNVRVFGTGKNGESVIVSICTNKAVTEVADEKWCVTLPAMKAGGPYEMKISNGEETIVFGNVMIGEVWLAGGQSNMELELQNCMGGKDFLANDKTENVRYYYTQKNCNMDEKFFRDEENTGWSCFDSESARAWSAVAYFYAKELAARLGVTVGIIGCNWGGTSASYWMSRESLEKDTDLKAYLDDFDNAVAGRSREEMDKEYLDYVRRFWKKVYAQVDGCMEKDGGPVIGIQIENEYGHVGGLQGPEGEAHIRTLTAMAKEIGFDVPLYTATGWGGACIGDLLPVMGGYCEAPWDQRTCEIEPNANFVFSHTRNDALIACDHHVENANSYNEEDFPFLTAELGGGLQVTMHRRPVAKGCDVGAMSTVKMGSGAGLLGYYMYHGGSNPKGKLSTLQESRATGYLNDLPEINYDFNAPIRQYGTISDSYREIKLLALFLNDFGEDMASLRSEIPTIRILPGDMHTVRTACRHDADHGYVFFNNYQRRWKMDDHPQVKLEGLLDGKASVGFPAFDLKEGMYGFFPYNMKLNDAVLHTALATPLCVLHTKKGDAFVFYGDLDPQIQWEGDARAELCLISRQEALNAWKVHLDQDYLVLSENYVWEENGELVVTGSGKTMIAVYPAVEKGIVDFKECGKRGNFTLYERIYKAQEPEAELVCKEQDKEKAVYELKLAYPGEKNYHDAFAFLTWYGNRMEVFDGEEKINDYFYTGQEALLSLGYFEFPEKLKLVVYPLHPGDPIFLEKQPDAADGCACKIEKLHVETIFR